MPDKACHMLSKIEQRFLPVLPISGEEEVGDDGGEKIWQQVIKNTQNG